MLGGSSDRLLVGCEEGKVLLLNLWEIAGFVEKDVIAVDNERFTPHNTMERLSILLNDLGRAFPISVLVPLEVHPVASIDFGWISVKPPLEGLLNSGVGLCCYPWSG